MMCVVNFVFALSQLQGVEWGWPGRQEPDDEQSPASYGRGDSFLFKVIYFYLYWYSYIVYFVVTQLPSLERWALLPFWGFPALTCSLFF